MVNTFEETFGEVYDSGKGVMGSHSLPRRVVSLASFNGDGSVVVITFLCFNKWVMINN